VLSEYSLTTVNDNFEKGSSPMSELLVRSLFSKLSLTVVSELSRIDNHNFYEIVGHSALQCNA